MSVRDLVVAYRNPVDLAFDLTDPGIALGAAVFRQLGVPERASGPMSGRPSG